MRALEISTKVPKKFRFPYFRKYVLPLLRLCHTLTSPSSRLCWYVAEKTLKDLKAKAEFPSRILNGMDALARFLIKESRILERTSSTESARKDTKEQIPGTIKDPTALARELRWRVRLAAGHDSDDELESPFAPKDKANGSANGNGKASSVTPAGGANPLKRKRGGVGSAVSTDSNGGVPQRPRFKGFIPRDWDQTELRPVETDAVDEVPVRSLPTKDDGLEWFDTAAQPSSSSDHPMNGASRSEKAKRTRTIDEVVKLRRTVGAGEGAGSVVTRLERETVRRVYESWSFDGSKEVEDVEVVEDVKIEDAPPIPAAQPQEMPLDPIELAPIREDEMDATFNAPADGPVLDPPLSSHIPTGFDTSGMPPQTLDDMLVDVGFAESMASDLPSLTA